jgi:hypothetical protein
LTANKVSFSPAFLAGPSCSNERRAVDPWRCFSSAGPLCGPLDSALFGPFLLVIGKTVS